MRIIAKRASAYSRNNGERLEWAPLLMEHAVIRSTAGKERNSTIIVSLVIRFSLFLRVYNSFVQEASVPNRAGHKQIFCAFSECWNERSDVVCLLNELGAILPILIAIGAILIA